MSFTLAFAMVVAAARLPCDHQPAQLSNSKCDRPPNCVRHTDYHAENLLITANADHHKYRVAAPHACGRLVGERGSPRVITLLGQNWFCAITPLLDTPGVRSCV